MTSETASPMHGEHASAAPVAAEADDTRPCAYCLTRFLPRKSWQRFCAPACRTNAAELKLTTGMRGVVSSVCVMKRGDISVTLRFGLDERDRALKLEPGHLVGVEKA